MNYTFKGIRRNEIEGCSGHCNNFFSFCNIFFIGQQIHFNNLIAEVVLLTEAR